MKKTAKKELFWPVILPGIIIGSLAGGYFLGRSVGKSYTSSLERYLEAYTGKQIKKSQAKDAIFLKAFFGTLGTFIPLMIGTYIGYSRAVTKWERQLPLEFRKVLARKVPSFYLFSEL
ncbi:MAG: hypothetical protein QXI58_02725 [Candidatus Micrarchaeia archaeon]